jgi:hypothetical protein
MNTVRRLLALMGFGAILAAGLILGATARADFPDRCPCIEWVKI